METIAGRLIVGLAWIDPDPLDDLGQEHGDLIGKLERGKIAPSCGEQSSLRLGHRPITFHRFDCRVPKVRCQAVWVQAVRATPFGSR
jgi:hypothetical protein